MESHLSIIQNGRKMYGKDISISRHNVHTVRARLAEMNFKSETHQRTEI